MNGQHDERDAACRRARSQSGTSLIEILVAVAILMGVFVGIMAGFFTTTAVSGAVDSRSDAQSAVDAVGERVATMPYRNCATAAQLTTDYRNWSNAMVPLGFVVTVERVTYLSGTSAAYLPTCSTDHGAQLLTVSVVSTDAGAERGQADVVLRNPVARPT